VELLRAGEPPPSIGLVQCLPRLLEVGPRELGQATGRRLGTAGFLRVRPAPQQVLQVVLEQLPEVVLREELADVGDAG
jgi:hypothetical protein